MVVHHSFYWNQYISKEKLSLRSAIPAEAALPSNFCNTVWWYVIKTWKSAHKRHFFPNLVRKSWNSCKHQTLFGFSCNINVLLLLLFILVPPPTHTLSNVCWPFKNCFHFYSKLPPWPIAQTRQTLWWPGPQCVEQQWVTPAWLTWEVQSLIPLRFLSQFPGQQCVVMGKALKPKGQHNMGGVLALLFS